MHLRHVLSALCFLIPLRGFSEALPSSIPLSLREAVQTSLEKNSSFAQTKEKENQADLNIPVARSIFYPNLTAEGVANKQKDATNNVFSFNNGDPYNQYSASLRLSQLLYQYGSVSSVDSAKKARLIARYNTMIAKRDLTNSIIQSYYLISLNTRNISTLVEQRKIVAESLQTAERRAHSGSGRMLDLLQVKTQLALLDGQILTARNQLEESRASLASLLGNSKSQQFVIKDSLEAPTFEEIEASIDRKNIVVPEILRDEVSIAQVDDQRKVLLGQNLPYLNLLGTYSFTSHKDSTVFEQPANSWAIGLQLTIPLFSGMSSIYQNKALLSTQMQLQLDRSYVEDQVNLQQINNKKNLETAFDSIKIGEIALQLAKESLKEAQRNYRLATIDYLQYLSVQQQHVVAEQSLNSYKYNYITAMGNYYAAAGQEMSRLVDLIERNQH